MSGQCAKVRSSCLSHRIYCLILKPITVMINVFLLFCSADALQQNQDMEFERNKERFNFLKWGAKAFKNMLIVPPGSGIVHQVCYTVHVNFHYNSFCKHCSR